MFFNIVYKENGIIGQKINENENENENDNDNDNDNENLLSEHG